LKLPQHQQFKSFEDRLESPYIMNPSRFGGGANMDDTGLQIYWKFNEASGTIENKSQAAASKGTAGDGTVTGATYGATGILGDCLDFDGSNDNMKVASAGTVDGEQQSATAKWTLNFWIYSHAAGAGTDIIFDSVNSTGSNIGTYMRWESGPKLRHSHVNQAGSAIITGGITSFTVSLNAWHMITETFDYSLGSNNYTIRVDDGTPDTQNTGVLGNGSTPTHPFTLAEAYSGNDNPYNGLIDEFSFWNRPLSDAEITALYNSGAGMAIY
jgi:hypothetical protein